MSVQELDTRTAVTSLRRKDLLGIADLSPEEISLVLDTAEAMKEVGSRPIKKVPALRGKTVVKGDAWSMRFFQNRRCQPRTFISTPNGKHSRNRSRA